jgi:hypothetical protein
MRQRGELQFLPSRRLGGSRLKREPPRNVELIGVGQVGAFTEQPGLLLGWSSGAIGAATVDSAIASAHVGAETQTWPY